MLWVSGKRKAYTMCLDCFVKENHKIYTEDSINDWCECTICGFRSAELSLHIKNDHPEVADIYSGPKKAKSICDRLLGDKNPGYNHGGKFSKFSKNFIHGYDDAWHKDQNEKHSEWSKEHSHFTRNAYESVEEYSKAQTRNLEYFVGKYGEDEGKARHIAKTEKWIKNFKKNNFSKVSQTLFDEIMKEYTGDVYYATHQREEMIDYINKEYRLNLGDTYCMPDFIDISTKKIIEFDGIYWHRATQDNKHREEMRDRKIKSLGYQILHVSELRYKNNPEEVIKECLAFLKR